MKRVLGALLCLSMPALAQDICTFDLNEQLRVLAVASGLYPHGRLYPAERQISWSAPDGGFTTFSYGGCADLGSTIVQQDRLPAARDQERVFAVARTLARRYWSQEILGSTLAADTLITGLEASRFSVERKGEDMTYHVSDPHYVQLYVVHRYIDGMDRITLSWQGAY